MDTTDTTPMHRSTVKGFQQIFSNLQYSDRRRRRLSQYQITGTASWVGLWFTILSLKNWKMRSGYVSYYWYWYSAREHETRFGSGRERTQITYASSGLEILPIGFLKSSPSGGHQDISIFVHATVRLTGVVFGDPTFSACLLSSRGLPTLWLDTSQYSKAGRLLLVCNEFMTWFQSWECQAVLNLKLKH